MVQAIIYTGGGEVLVVVGSLRECHVTTLSLLVRLTQARCVQGAHKEVVS